MLPLFAYGTLLPGEVRWGFLAPFVLDHGSDDTVRGDLFDTGQGFPAAVFASAAVTGGGGAGDERDGVVCGRVVHGRVFRFAEADGDEALRVLDDVEGAADGGYRRIEVVTGSGVRCWAYEYGGGLDLVPIPGGSWVDRLSA